MGGSKNEACNGDRSILGSILGLPMVPLYGRSLVFRRLAVKELNFSCHNVEIK